jgi:hypothetical protein
MRLDPKADAAHWKEVAERLGYDLAATFVGLHTDRMRTLAAKTIVRRVRRRVAEGRPEPLKAMAAEGQLG